MFLDEEIKRINNIFKNINTRGKIVLWGAAENTIKLFQYTDIAKYNIKEIVDSNKGGEAFFGYIIKEPCKVTWSDVVSVIISSFYRENEIEMILRNEYKYDGQILKLNSVNQKKPFYQHLTKSELQVPAEYRETIQANEKFHNYHEGETLFIIGNGPSIKNIDLTKIKNAKKMVVSNFYLHENYNMIKPDYYCYPRFIYNNDLNDHFWNQYLCKVGEESGYPQFFFDISEKRIIDTCSGFRDKKVNYMYLDQFKTECYDEIDITQRIMEGRSVSVDCLQLAIYMGFKKIYLLGIEHTNILNRNYEYFFDKKKDPFYNCHPGVEQGKDVRDFNVILSGTYKLWEQYKALADIAKNNNVCIYNAVHESLLDIFERVDYNSVVS